MFKCKIQRERFKEKFFYDFRKVLKMFDEYVRRIFEDIKVGKNFYFDILMCGLSNVYFDEKLRFIKMGDKFLRCYFFNVVYVRKFMQMFFIMVYVKRFVSEGKYVSFCEVYYVNKYIILGMRENIFEDQSESDLIIEDFERMFGVLREEMYIIVDRCGYIYGDIVICDGEDEFNVSRFGSGGWVVLGMVEYIQFLEINVDYVLVVEIVVMVDCFIEEKFLKRENVFIIVIQGQVLCGVRCLIYRFYYEEGLFIIVFIDGDFYGWYIYLIIKQGLINFVYFSDKLVIFELKFVGMIMDDIKKYGFENVIEKFKGILLNKKGGLMGDYKRIFEEMNYFWFQNKEWQRQFQFVFKWGVRIEQQVLVNKFFEFVVKEYFLEKINNGDFLL